MTKHFDCNDVKFSSSLGDWLDWEIDDGEIVITRRGEIKLNGKLLSDELVALAAKYSSAFQDALRNWGCKVEELTCDSNERMTDERALRECQEAQRVLNDHVANNFVCDICVESNGGIGFAYDPERYAGIEARTADAA